MDDVLKDDGPLLQHLEKGFKLSATINLITNIKAVILDALSDDNESDDVSKVKQILMMIAPVFMM